MPERSADRRATGSGLMSEPATAAVPLGYQADTGASYTAARGYGWAWDERTDSVKQIEAGSHRPQCSACFIISVDDTMESIMDLAKTEAMLSGVVPEP